VVTTARTALGVDPTPLSGHEQELAEHETTDDQLERLLQHCRAHRRSGSGPVLDPDEVPQLIERLAEELLLWRRSHPGELPGR
jgi:hypothetical protein